MKNSSRYFQNGDCEYYPCHRDADPENFSCLFCFCPLYHKEDCPGTPSFLPNGVKDCSECTLPHTDYDRVIQELRKEQ